MRKSTVYLFYLLAGAILLWTASLNLDVARLLLPGDDLTPFLILAIFDAGALCWLASVADSLPAVDDGEDWP